MVADAVQGNSTPPAYSPTASPLRHRGSACAAVMASGLSPGCSTSWAILASLAGWMKPGCALGENRSGPRSRVRLLHRPS